MRSRKDGVTIATEVQSCTEPIGGYGSPGGCLGIPRSLLGLTKNQAVNCCTLVVRLYLVPWAWPHTIVFFWFHNRNECCIIFLSPIDAALQLPWFGGISLWRSINSEQGCSALVNENHNTKFTSSPIYALFALIAFGPITRTLSTALVLIREGRCSRILLSQRADRALV